MKAKGIGTISWVNCDLKEGKKVISIFLFENFENLLIFKTFFVRFVRNINMEMMELILPISKMENSVLCMIEKCRHWYLDKIFTLKVLKMFIYLYK